MSSVTAEQSASCPDPGQLVELARGALDGPKRDELLAHIKACAECSEVLQLWTAADGASAGPSSGAATPNAQPARRPPGPGDVLSAKYRVDRILGIGGMGMVVAATHLQLGRPVAVKLMLPETASSKETAERFAQEARTAAEIQSEHVVRVLDAGSLDDGSPFLVMEFLRGSDFAHVVRARGPLPVLDVAGYLLQACDALAEAHALGIVHRDLKPANLFLSTRADGSPLVKVLDFGISKLTRRGASAGVALTKSRSIMGTPLYMSPEQLRDTRSVGPSTDIWSLGCILYELLTARPPFVAQTAEALGALIAAGPTPHVRDVRPEVPSALEAIIDRCLEKYPAARFGSLGELARELGPFAPADTAPLVKRIERVCAGPSPELPFAETMQSERPPRFAGTGSPLARSGVSAASPEPGARPFWVAGAAVALAVLVLTFARGRWFAAPAAVSVSPAAAPAAAASEAPVSELGPGGGQKVAPGAMPSPAPPTAGIAAAPKDESLAVVPPSPALSASSVAPKKLVAKPSSKPSPAFAPGAKAAPASPTKDRDAID